MKQKSDFEKWLDSWEKDLPKENKLFRKFYDALRSAGKAGFNILSDRELEEMLAEFFYHWGDSKERTIENETKNFLANWKKKRGGKNEL